MTTLVIDGDIIAYRVSTICEQPIQWADGLWTLHAYEDDVRKGLDEDIYKLVEESAADKVIVALSDTANFRKGVADYYKANRKNVRRPMLLPFARDYVMERHAGVIWKNLEADDVLGILTSSSDEYMAWSIDKDLLTIPGKHWIDQEVVTISEEQADYTFLKQALTGDLTDNYGGCPKIGDKTADKILSEDCSWATVVKTYLKAGLTEEVALENARLARILRAGEYNQETGEVALWNPSV